ncbi:conserved hypothetical protein [Amphibacillus marinus]|uniref:Purine nucleoside phosphorylase n=1 Tax=Amphibacillus marinus TaxID=872970 RepID=A0A1H8I243_9BACI|nr:peptidoglycan editing factor PgeF [Amphibacillus marinus]SEN62569.1 conserved hypothetical protein [Amphibacillus marinus]
MEPFQLDNPGYYHIHAWLNQFKGLTAGITTRSGGFSKPPFAGLNMGLHVQDEYEQVMKNRQWLAESLGYPLEQWVIGEQVHGSSIYKVGKADALLGAGASAVETAVKGIDGLITKESGILLGAFFADCVPLFFYDPYTNWLGIAHAGWRGTVGMIAREMVSNFQQEGVNPAHLHIAIGPAISQVHYRVDDFVVNQVPERYRNKVVEQLDDQNNQYLIDLPRLNQLILIEAGIKESNILMTNYCTYVADNLYSYRRDQGQTGRMLAFIGRD